MQKKNINFQIKGMRRDMSISKADPSYAYEIINMRLTPIDGEDTLSLVNEKGNAPIRLASGDGDIFTFSGCQYVGHCVINQYLVLFVRRREIIEGVSSLPDNVYSTIYCIDFDTVHTINGEDYYDIKIKFDTHTYNDLGFNPEHPLETIGDYETENIIKVYFTDGIYQPRVINIKKDYAHDMSFVYGQDEPYNSDELNFVRNLKLNSNAIITIDKQESPGSLFSSGTIQYCFTYFTTNAQESNIFYTSPLYYINPGNRGGAADETVGNSFKITIQNPDNDFDYLRVYSIRRTSLNTTPIVKRVVDLPIKEDTVNLYYVDNNTSGEEIDPTILYYIGGEPVSASTFEAKDNTLFLGNIKLLRSIPSYKVNRNFLKSFADTIPTTAWSNTTKTISVNSNVDPSVSGFTYNYESKLKGSSKNITVFKTGETYRLGYQLQHKSGVWTDVYWITDTIIQDTKPTSTSTGTVFKNRILQLNGSISQEITSLQRAGYIAVRPMIVYPKMSDRTVLCQGMICPTVFNLKDRFDNTMYAQASWFARPIPYLSGSDYESQDSAAVEYRHNQMLKSSLKFGNEIQCMDIEPLGGGYLHNNAFWSGTAVISKYSDEYSDYYFVDNSLVTLNTPELDFDESFILNSDSNYTFKIVGVIPINATTSDISILASAPFEGDTCSVLTNVDSGTVKLGAINKKFSIVGVNGWHHSPIYPQWVDRKLTDKHQSYNGNNNDLYANFVAGIYISPWHKTGQFTKSQKRTSIESKHIEYLESQFESGILKQKKLSHLQYSYNTYYLDSSVNYANAAMVTYNSTEPTAERIKVPEYAFGRYYGNVDKVIVPGSDNGGSYMIEFTTDRFEFNAQQNFPESTDHTYVSVPEGNSIYTDTVEATYSKMMNNTSIFDIESLNISADLKKDLRKDLSTGDPIMMKYKSTPHIVISLNPSQTGLNDPQKTILPSFTGKPSLTSNTTETNQAISPSVSPITMVGEGYIWLGEIWNNNITNRFGGNTEDALIANDWVVGGDAVPLSTSAVLTWDRGDTYYQRYDCLKTYPYTLEDENSIVEVVSFMCETRMNIDGRYDRNRGTASLVAHPTNYNLFNPVYSQQDNFFTYHGFNSQNNVTRFPNMITWTLTKAPNALVDKWTNITLASTLNLDGDRGEIRRLEKIRNDIFSFQDKGISRILFNDRTALTTTSGAPVELVNSGRVEGKQYMTELEGLTNKQSLRITPNGAYFIDGKTKSAYLFNGQQCVSLSDTKAMKIFFDGQPDDFNIFYDSKEKDVYFVNSNYCLCFSEKLGEFAGFFNYENIPMMDNVKDRFISILPNEGSLWEHYAGDYNTFYGTIRPHSITFVGNDNLPLDKFYTNLDFISDSFLNGVYTTTKTFDHIKVWDEYQSGEYSLVNTNGIPSNLKKKFRIWRAQIPRANWNGRDRIRNPWCFVQLRMDNPSTYKTILHQTSLEYYV